jgi:hypothetical protein
MLLLFINVSVNKALQVIRNKLHNDDTLAERYVMQVEAIMELPEVCLRTIIFWRITSSSNRKMAWLMEALYQQHLLAQHKPFLWLWYIDDTFVAWSHHPEWLQNLLSHLNSLWQFTLLTIETESDYAIPFVDLLLIRKDIILAMKVYRKNTHTGCYISCKSNICHV